ncbi:TniB family NTP-binding protein [Ralstonia sp. ASV6]|uniref:TniB family NTP-binding protein n=1 Tax=Ralstonia sp. ASV6 TaxID=2795124 RepID=UPI0018EA98BE|nr:TniB family NTP-binding protein [Ralstonia sp. ASV6]
MSAAEFTHLTPKAAEKLCLPLGDRIEHILKPRWIGYPRAQEVLDDLELLLRHPRQARMPNMLLVGETNNGKTVLIEHFLALHPADPNPNGEAVRIPVLYVQAPPGPDERGFYNAILSRLFQRLRPSESTDQKRDRTIGILRQVDLGMIVIDEIHHLLAGPLLKQRNFLNVLKYVGNELRVPLVGVGTGDAVRAVQVDLQLQNRFTPAVLPRWELNADYARLLSSFERVIPLALPSNLTERAMASRLLHMTGGTIGELSKLLNAAAIYAIKRKTERIDARALDSCGYVPPAERRAAVARV